MKIHLYSSVHFEEWNWENSITSGIGGSETHHVEMCWRLARRGHDVTSYVPLPKASPHEWRGTRWQHFNETDFSQPGLWVVYRSPETMAKFLPRRDDQTVWFMAQDESYAGWQPEWIDRIDRYLCLCQAHGTETLRKEPRLKGRVWVTSNGVKCDLIREVEAAGVPVRNAKKLIYASSPDRGLKPLLTIFKRAREFVRDLELHIFYGFDNIDKLIAWDEPRFKHYRKIKDDILKLADQPGVFLRGRVSQRELYREWLTAGIWCYPTNFTETSCITCMEAQALGAVPITHPLWALAENVHHGIFIEGDAYGDALTQARYTAEIIRLATHPEMQVQLRTAMMVEARAQFNWERWVDQWEAWLLGGEEGLPHSQFAFQHKYATGRILNIGCDTDPSNFKGRGAVNVDVCAESPILREPNKADVIADSRHLPESLKHRFDSVILGDILEHMSEEDAVRSLVNAKSCLENGGVVIVTCPNDPRPKTQQHLLGTTTESYVDGVSCYHERPISREDLTALVERAGLRVERYQLIDYSHFEGHGMVCR